MTKSVRISRVKPDDPIAVVYWLYDATCAAPERDGYVGACTNIAHRLHNHRRSFGTHKGSVGAPNGDFKIKILLTGTLIECDALERQLRPHSKIGWNRNRGGRRSLAPHTDNRKLKSPEHREKIRQSLLQHHNKPRPERAKRGSPEHVAKIVASLTGKRRSDEAKANMRAAQVKTPEKRAKISAGLTGHKRSQQSIDNQKATLATKDRSKSPETRERMRLAALARYQDPAERERLSETVKAGRAAGKDQSGVNNPRFGVTMSDETKAKIAEKAKARFAAGFVNPMKGRKRTEEEKRKIREGIKRAGPLTPEQRQRQIENSQRGDQHWRNRQAVGDGSGADAG